MKKDTLSDKIIKHVITQPDANFCHLTVNDISDTFGMDRFKLSRIFKLEKNITLEDYLHQDRMTRCAHLLMSEGELTVKDISTLMGFCTCDYFSQVFRKQFGMTPGQFRQLKTKRTGVDRRKGLEDRRKNLRGPLPASGDRRRGVRDRRKGPTDRRLIQNAEPTSAETPYTGNSDAPSPTHPPRFQHSAN